LDAASQKLQSSKVGPGGFVFVSASTGFPPFYGVSILAGTLRIPFPIFFFPGTVGRLIRFALMVLFPQVFKDLWL
jgi:membrane protein YqaA with SNARE-associated domain